MKRRQHWLVAVLAGLTALLLLSTVQAQGMVQVNVAVTTGPNADAARAVLPSLSKKLPGIKVNIIEIPWTDIYQRQLLDFTARRGNYDLVQQSTSFFGQYVLSGHLEPLDKYFNNPKLVDKAAFDLKDFNPRVLELVASYKRKLYALPYMYFPQILVYREDLMKQIGAKVPVTTDEYLDVVRRLDKVSGIRGTSVVGVKAGAGGNVYQWAVWLFNFGGDFADARGRPTLNSAAAVRALEYYVQLYKLSPSEAINNGTDQVTSAFGAGTIGIMIMDADNAGSLLDPKNTKFSGVIRYAPVPEGPYKGPIPGQGTPLLGAWSSGVSAYSKHKEEAFRVLTTLLSGDPAIADTFAKIGIHPRLSALRRAGKTLPNYAVVAKELGDVKVIPVIPNWQRIEEALATAISKALLGQATPKQALDEAQKVAESVAK